MCLKVGIGQMMFALRLTALSRAVRTRKHVLAKIFGHENARIWYAQKCIAHNCMG